ncbi:hypothetical protein CALCODRAFT_56419 [Calocera cornea HHB12733]|uniref:Uncharacterized protein n=1 Tax=Calocera cornea HHB12733 TaxID=1353952 RepID=A0A165DPH6_9BASI|nr:hypothetical protein CALCODRAFT_56419 [Calocera cornea HHB12733]
MADMNQSPATRTRVALEYLRAVEVDDKEALASLLADGYERRIVPLNRAEIKPASKQHALDKHYPTGRDGDDRWQGRFACQDAAGLILDPGITLSCPRRSDGGASITTANGYKRKRYGSSALPMDPAYPTTRRSHM